MSMSVNDDTLSAFGSTPAGEMECPRKSASVAPSLAFERESLRLRLRSHSKRARMGLMWADGSESNTTVSAFALCFVSIFLQSSHFPFSLAPFSSLICGSDSSRAYRSRYSLECSVSLFPISVVLLWFSVLVFLLELRSLAG